VTSRPGGWPDVPPSAGVAWFTGGMSSSNPTTDQNTDPHAARRAWATVGSRTRLAVMLLGGTAAAVATGVAGSWGYAPLTGWDIAALIFTVSVWLAICPMSASVTATHATREDPGHAGTDILVVIASVASLAAVGFVLIQASSAKGAQQDLLAGLGLASVALSWFTVHTLFTLRYARLYYTGKDGGVNFNQDAPPRYLDFAYLAFTIGMTFQVSDTDLQTPAVRHSALRHALLSYLFGVVIIASTINLIAGLGTSSGGGG
jgi:uncharacterized membrane protein